MMENNRTISLTISLPKHYRDILRKKAAEWNLAHLDELFTAAGIAASIIVEYLDDWEKGLMEDQKNEQCTHTQ